MKQQQESVLINQGMLNSEQNFPQLPWMNARCQGIKKQTLLNLFS